MRQIFIFTAGDKAARTHLADSITKPVDLQWLREAADPAEAEYLASLVAVDGGFYAWGAVPGPVNERNWQSMQVGDQVLAVFDNRYRYAASVTAKLHNAALANRIWKADSDGQTWEYMYALSRPIPIDVSVIEGKAADYLNKGYRGFTRISADKIKRIVADFGSQEEFMKSVFNAPLPANHVESALAEAVKAADSAPAADFNPADMADGRRRTVQEVVRRQGQPAFRRALLEAYQGRCVVTNCDVESVLQAAHIAPYLGAESNAVVNGLLLRADIHTLFDLGLLKVTTQGVVEIHETLWTTDYAQWAGRTIAAPISAEMRPSEKALAHKYAMIL